MCHFVEDFADTPAGFVPRIRSRLDWRDILGTIGTRSGFIRNNYRVAPGLYCLGNPGPDAPVLVSANYKLSFDALRKELEGTDVWILVLDTHGINVWCAAGKGSFSTSEVIRRVQETRLEKQVRHKKLILPQLSATGVCGRDVKKGCGFEVVWGPIRARDLKAFLAAGMQAKESMRRVTFSFWERAVLTPVEIYLIVKSLCWILLFGFMVSGIGPGFFSFQRAWTRGIDVAIALLWSILAGAVLTPMLLPYIPGKAFSLKGGWAGLIFGMIAGTCGWAEGGPLGSLALVIFTTTASSYFAMNFTGSTPFTSPSGVEKEMRKAIPIQLCALLTSLLLWIGSAFFVV
jgi:hypothetical protein